MLPKKDLKSKFMHVYNHGFAGSPVVFITKLWASVLFPSIAQDSMFGVGKKKARICDAIQTIVPASYLRIKTVHDARDPHILCSVPVFSFNVNNTFEVFAFLQKQFLKASAVGLEPEPNAQQVYEIAALKQYFVREPGDTAPRDIVFHVSQVLRANKDLSGASVLNLRSCLLQMRMQTKGSLCVVFFDFKITKDEAQQLTTTEWDQMRDIDVYPLLHQWVLTSYGERGQAPIASFPISKIATTLPKSHVLSARINEHGLSIGPNGRPYYLPREIDVQQTIQYEERYTQAGTRADGSYALTDISEGAHALDTGTEIKVKLPKNVPVLIDWVNNKYSHTDTNGLLKVQDLMRYRKAEAAHLRILMEERVVTEEHIETFTRMGKHAGLPESAFLPSLKDVEDVTDHRLRSAFTNAKTPLDWFSIAVEAWERIDDTGTVYFVNISTVGFGPFRPLARFFKLVAKAVTENLPAVYREYSVKTVSENLPWLIMVDHYADSMDELRASDVSSRIEAINQGVDPNWVPKPIPMIDRLHKIGYLPHQFKVRNLLRDSPLFAILPVQAGGGKSLLLITDILYEILFHRSHPYILLCPGHLVANYVNEILYFTGGQLNVIPITAEVIRVHGFERLQKIVEAMPRNSVIVCDYDTLRYRQRSICYGTTPVLVYPVIDFLRQFRFGYAGLDESHKVKNDTARTKATMCLITDVPKIRLASGTMAHDSPSDIAMQVASMDPCLFGTRDEFNKKYGLAVSGGRVMHWKPGAQEQIRRKINSRVVTAGAMRKEWAAFLPTKREWIGGVNLTDAQQTVYDAILAETLDKIEEAARSNKELSRFLGAYDTRPLSEDVEEYDDQAEDDEHDEEAGSDLAALLKPYLARLERFLMAPGKDPLGQKLLRGDDLKSPKVLMILERIKLHLFGGTIKNDEGQDVPYGPFPGKCLIFTNNIVSAEEVWELAPPELKRCGLLYKAENKVEHGSRFEKMDRVRWMVGVEVSMNEGLNFQFVSRTIRTEQVWNPGTLEQGNSRSNRPQLKVVETRNYVFYDTIVINNTIDITKTARLISKVISVAKFENSENPSYARIPDVPIIKMSLESIQKFNTWQYIDADQPGLKTYAQALAVYEEVRDADYEEYKNAYITQYGEGPVKKMIEVADSPSDALILSLVPYAPGGNLYGQSVLGLVRVDEYLNLIEDEIMTGADEEVADDEQVDTEPDFSPVEQKAAALKGRAVHTEFGEGIISRCGAKIKYVNVQLKSGFTVQVRKSACFLIDVDQELKPIRSEIAKLLNMELAPVQDLPAQAYRMTRAQSKTKRIREMRKTMRENRRRDIARRRALTVDISLVNSNGYVGLAYDVDEQNLTAIQTLQACGFRLSPAFYYAKVPTAISFVRMINEWEERGIGYDPKFLKAGARSWFAEMFAQLKNGIESNAQQAIIRASRAGLPNFYRTEHKASADTKLIKPYPVLEDGTAYIALPKDGQAGSRLAIKHSKGAIKWGEAGPRLSYFGTIKEIKQVAKRMKEAGILVRNPAALNRQFRDVRNLKVRVLK